MLIGDGDDDDDDDDDDGVVDDDAYDDDDDDDKIAADGCDMPIVMIFGCWLEFQGLH